MSKQAERTQGILLFSLGSKQTFALGTLKIKELVPYTQLNIMPQSHPAVIGTAHIRGKTLPVVDMAAAMGRPPLDAEATANGYIIITDCQRKEVGFLVAAVDRIIECSWRDIEAPPASLGRNAFVAGVAKLEKNLVQLVDVEQIFARLYSAQETAADLGSGDNSLLQALNILVVDDSSVARKQLSDALKHFTIPYQITANGQEALDIMTAAAAAGKPIDILVSDIEMPGLDGYELAFEVRNKPALARAYIILHTSISSEISVSQAHQVGANEALTKFDVDELMQAMLRGAQSG
ncbi:MAG TPA: chemotaxis protein [Cellvibrionaceae bacterium]